VNGQSATAPEPNLRGPYGPTTGKLIAWLSVIGFLCALNYTLNYAVTTNKQDTQKALYHYSTAVGSVFVYGLILLVMLWIAGFRRDLLALRRPKSWLVSLGLAVALFIGAGLVISIIDHILHGGREQGVVPQHWMPSHAGAYAANWVVVAGVAPVVEELAFRGLGFTLVAARWGSTVAIIAIGLLFAASHGFVQAFPELAVLGCSLAWLRFKVDSIYPGMLVHAAFNSFALASVFWS
jgi:membrane protease YdiL (CAAX protease family)